MKLISSQTKFKSSIFRVTVDRAVDPDGFEIKRAIVHHPGSAVMMPVDARGRVLLVRQYRLPAKDYLWEIPAGRVDPGENVLQAAKRELREETGLRAAKWTKLAEYYASPGFLDEKMIIFAAQHLTEGEQQPMEDERIEMRWFTSRELDRMIRTFEIRDAKTMVAFLSWKRYGGGTRGARSSK